MSQTEEHDSNELGGAFIGASVSEEAVANEDTKEETVELSLRDGDVFVFANGVVAFTVLQVSSYTGKGRFVKIRLFASVSDSIDLSEDELVDYVNTNNLTRLTSRYDQSIAMANSMILNEGDVFTKGGEFYMEILSSDMLYLDPIGRPKYIIGVRTNDNVVACRDYLWVVSALHSNADQFAERNEEEA